MLLAGGWSGFLATSARACAGLDTPSETVPSEISAEDRLAAQRMGGLLDYIEALVKLDEQVAVRLAQHKLQDGSQFVLHQHELVGLPGVQLDASDAEGPIWLRIERLKRTKPPEAEEKFREWLNLSSDPFKPPALQETRHVRLEESEKDRLIEVDDARPEDCAPSIKADEDPKGKGSNFFDVMLRLEDRPKIREAAEAYCSGPWAKWAEVEKPRRRSISVYQRLFEIGSAAPPIRKKRICRARMGNWSRKMES